MQKSVKRIFANKFFRGGLFFTGATFIVNIINYFFNFLAARSLGPSGYGEIATLFSYTIIASVPMTVIATIIIRKISSAHEKSEVALSLEQYYWQAIKKWGILFIPLLLFIPLMPRLTNLSAPVAYAVIPFILLTFLSNFYNSALQGLHLFFIASVLGVIVALVKLGGAILTTLNIDGLITILIFLFLSLLSLLIGGYYSMHFSLKNISRESIRKINKRILSIVIGEEFIVTTISILALTVFNNIDVIFVKKFFQPVDSGIYSSWSLFAKIVLYGIGPLISISFIFFAGNANKKRQTQTLKFSLAIMAIIGIFSYILYSTYASQIISLLFGPKFTGISPYLGSASLFGTFYTCIYYINNFFLARKSRFALILPVVIPIYILLLAVIDKKIANIIHVNILFSAAVACLYLIACVKTFLYNSQDGK